MDKESKSINGSSKMAASPVKFSVTTFGCKTNQSESDSIIMELLPCGFKLVEYSDSPDFALINTCTVTSASDSKARQFIRKIKLLNPDAKIIVTGCFVDLNDSFLKENGITFIFKNNEKDRIADLIKKEAGFKYVAEKNYKHQEYTGKHTREFIKIQDGCEQKCSYCIVPYVRSRYASEIPEKIISRVKDSSSAGIEEIVLTGIHIGKYGVDFNNDTSASTDGILFPGFDLSAICRLLIDRTSIKRIRLSSIEINEITDSLLNLVAGSNRIARHLHIPLQSGSNRILEKMGRPYDMEYFMGKIKRIIKLIPGITLTTDVIAGFPSESEPDFNDTVRAVREINFSRVHVFKYSPRKFTPAASMENQVPEEIKNVRSLALRNIAMEAREKFINLNAGETLQVVVERTGMAGNYGSGMSENYIKVYFPALNTVGQIKTGMIVNVKTTVPFKDGLKGSIA
jgi:threonylcarbamoyladenosine tRNA methylthiotransferase MtaB